LRRRLTAAAHHPRWDDEKATRILRHVYREMGAGRKLLVVESVIPPGNERSFGKLLDLAMLVTPGDEERTEQDYRRLYEAAGFRS
jgi:O-methyltransferase domain